LQQRKAKARVLVFTSLAFRQVHERFGKWVCILTTTYQVCLPHLLQAAKVIFEESMNDLLNGLCCVCQYIVLQIFGQMVEEILQLQPKLTTTFLQPNF
jgi:hypothetical protein